NAQHDGAELGQIRGSQLLQWNVYDPQPHLPQYSCDVISRALDVTHLEFLGDLYIHNADALHARLIVVEGVQVIACDYGVAFTKLLSSTLQDRSNFRAALFPLGGSDCKVEVLLFPAMGKPDVIFRRCDLPTLRDCKM